MHSRVEPRGCEKVCSVLYVVLELLPSSLLGEPRELVARTVMAAINNAKSHVVVVRPIESKTDPGAIADGKPAIDPQKMPTISDHNVDEIGRRDIQSDRDFCGSRNATGRRRDRQRRSPMSGSIAP
jgi:hypothetical protein